MSDGAEVGAPVVVVVFVTVPLWLLPCTNVDAFIAFTCSKLPIMAKLQNLYDYYLNIDISHRLFIYSSKAVWMDRANEFSVDHKNEGGQRY